MHRRSPLFGKAARKPGVDAHEPLLASIRAGKVEFHWIGRGHCPGERLAPRELPGLLSRFLRCARGPGLGDGLSPQRRGRDLSARVNCFVERSAKDLPPGPARCDAAPMPTPSHPFRPSLFVAGILGLSGVALGAFGAHALAPALGERGMVHVWETASRYHLLHSAAVFAGAVWLHVGAAGVAGSIVWAIRCWTAGVVLFSGSLYWLALGGPKWLGPVTPLGGLALMFGWLFLVLAAARKSESTAD
jgi:uncharacterized membrane protein YgdD (TMEM256/DUF423 family)